MNNVFDRTEGGIAELEGTTSSTGAAKLRLADVNLVTGEYVLPEPTNPKRLKRTVSE